MPKLTQIKETKRGRLALFLDGEFVFSLDEDTFATAHLHEGDDLEPWQVEQLRKRKSRREILQDLAAKGIDRDTAARAVEDLYDTDETGEDPELTTARALVARQYAAKLAAGKRDQVAAALARRGFSHGVIRTVLDETDDPTESEP